MNFQKHLNPSIAIGFNDNNFSENIKILDDSKVLNNEKHLLKNY